jgi:hypothetical protein
MVHIVYKHTAYWILAISSVDARKLNRLYSIYCIYFEICNKGMFIYGGEPGYQGLWATVGHFS